MSGFETVVREFETIDIHPLPARVDAALSGEVAARTWGQTVGAVKVGIQPGKQFVGYTIEWGPETPPQDVTLHYDDIAEVNKNPPDSDVETDLRGPWDDWEENYIDMDADDAAPPVMDWKMEEGGRTTMTPVDPEQWSMYSQTNAPKAKKKGNLWVVHFKRVRFTGPIYDGDEEHKRINTPAQNPLRKFLNDFYNFSA